MVIFSQFAAAGLTGDGKNLFACFQWAWRSDRSLYKMVRQGKRFPIDCRQGPLKVLRSYDGLRARPPLSTDEENEGRGKKTKGGKGKTGNGAPYVSHYTGAVAMGPDGRRGLDCQRWRRVG